MGDLPWPYYFTFVTFKHLFFPLVIICEHLLSSFFSFTFKPKRLESFISSKILSPIVFLWCSAVPVPAHWCCFLPSNYPPRLRTREWLLWFYRGEESPLPQNDWQFIDLYSVCFGIGNLILYLLNISPHTLAHTDCWPTQVLKLVFSQEHQTHSGLDLSQAIKYLCKKA